MISWDEPPDESDSEEDLAELEARLYSQIYYEAAEDGSVDVNDDKTETVTEPVISDGYVVSAVLDSGEVKQSEDNSSHEVPDTSENLDKSVPCDLVCNDNSEGEDSRYSNNSKKIEKNPFYSGSDSEDDGIIVLPKPVTEPPVVIDVDDDSGSSAILISDEEETDKKDVVEIGKRLHNSKKRNINVRNNVSKRAGKREYYREEYGSDLEDNSLSDGDMEDVETDISLGNLLGSRNSGRVSSGKRKISDVFSSDLSEARGMAEIDCPLGWTRDMDQFYNKMDESVLDIELENVLDTMDPSPKFWKVDRSDVYGGGRERARYFGGGRRCHNCNQSGHVVRECPEPQKVTRCSMCGEAGHQESRCPVKGCLRCGQPGFSYQESCTHCRRLNDQECRECRYKGHLARECPDLWRRYHMSTGNNIVRPGEGDSSKPNKECWCCNCGRQGHLVADCRKYLYSKYPVTPLRVVNYSKPKRLDSEEDLVPVLKKSKMEKLYQSKSCPSSPTPPSSSTPFNSQPGSPRIGATSFSSSLLVKAQNKLDKRKKNSKRMTKEEQKAAIGEKLESGMTRSQVLEEIVNQDVKKTLKNAKKLKQIIRVCDQGLKARRAMRVAEFSGKRGFRRHQETDSMVDLIQNLNRENHLPVHNEAKGKRRKGANESDPTFTFVSKKSRHEEKVTRAAMIPTSVQAAWKFLKKEAQKINSSSSDLGKKLKKDLKQEIVGLKHGLHSSPMLKKVERKRLADIVINLRNHA